jgi:hypothetical protein
MAYRTGIDRGMTRQHSDGRRDIEYARENDTRNTLDDDIEGSHRVMKQSWVQYTNDRPAFLHWQREKTIHVCL